MSTDSLGRLIRSTEYDADNTIVQRIAHNYDEYGRLSSQSWVIGTTPYSESYTYADGASGDGSLTSLTTAAGSKINYNYDELRRLSGTSVTNASGTEIFKTAYGYKTVSGNQTSTQVQYFNVRNPSGGLISGYKYTYDSVGNITVIAKSESPYYPLAKYEYDSLNQLTKETCYDGLGSADSNITVIYTYTYDTAGNIRTVAEDGVVTQTYSYSTGDWKDMLVSVNGNSITYDGTGNPTSYPRFEDGVDYYMVWNQGRQLTYLDYATTANNETQIYYSYDADGIRTQKNVTTGTGTTTHSYVTQNGKVVRETIGTGSTAKILDFIYDANGRPFALKYTNGTAEAELYYYILNLQGDVVALMTESRSIVAKYSYNAWGELLSVTNANDVAITSATHIGNLNPLRYRGYYYDTETGFYYLQSRYYDPVMHRFINADCYTDTGAGFLGYNMFSYCNNNPIAYRDDSGEALYPTTFTVRDGGATVNEDVVVISIIDEGWGESSQIMGESFAQSIGNGSARVVYVTSSNFLDVWSSISESYVIIHTHGSPNVLCGSDFKLTTEDVRNLSAKANIKGMLITACSTGGNNNDDPNIAQIFSKKIGIDGLVVCSTTTVGGGDTYFEARYNGAWIIYRNAVFQNKRLPATISMQYVAKTVFDK